MRNIISISLKSIAFGIAPFIAGMLALYLTANVARVGFGASFDGPVLPFVVGILSTFFVLAFVASQAYAANEKSGNRRGFFIGIATAIVGPSLAAWYIATNSQHMAQFGLGIAVMALFLAGLAPSWFYMHWQHRKQTASDSPAADTTPASVTLAPASAAAS